MRSFDARDWVTLFFAAAIVALVILNLRTGFDKSVGEVRPAWSDKAQYPKVFVHGVTAFAAATLMVQVGVLWWIAALLLLAGIVAWEWSQGFFNRLDVVSGALGLIAAMTLWHYRLWTLWGA